MTMRSQVELALDTILLKSSQVLSKASYVLDGMHTLLHFCEVKCQILIVLSFITAKTNE